MGKISIPTFSDSHLDRPKYFLKNLFQYVEAAAVTSREIKFVLSQALKGPARDWWEHIEDSITGLQDFQKQFIKKYWSEQKQERVRRDLEFGFYNQSYSQSRSQYALQMYNDAMMLDEALSSKNIINKLSRHFDEIVREAVIGRAMETINELMQLLDNLDSGCVLNSKLANQSSANRSDRFSPRGFQSSTPYNRNGSYQRYDNRNNNFRNNYNNNSSQNNRRSYENPNRSYNNQEARAYITTPGGVNQNRGEITRPYNNQSTPQSRRNTSDAFDEQMRLNQHRLNTLRGEPPTTNIIEQVSPTQGNA